MNCIPLQLVSNSLCNIKSLVWDIYLEISKSNVIKNEKYSLSNCDIKVKDKYSKVTTYLRIKVGAEIHTSTYRHCFDINERQLFISDPIFKDKI